MDTPGKSTELITNMAPSGHISAAGVTTDGRLFVFLQSGRVFCPSFGPAGSVNWREVDPVPGTEASRALSQQQASK